MRDFTLIMIILFIFASLGYVLHYPKNKNQEDDKPSKKRKKHKNNRKDD